MTKENRAFKFGPFRLEVHERRLTREGHLIPLRGRVFDTLLALVSRHGCLVTKDELMAAVWPDSVVEETNLNHNICILRRALGEKATGEKYVETVPRQGYRFVADVQELREASASRIQNSWGSVQSVPLTHENRPRTLLPGLCMRWLQRRRIIALMVIAGFLVVGYSGMVWLGFIGNRTGARIMLAVLPFEDLSSNPGDAFVGAGFDHEIISQLGQWDPLRVGVIARTSSRAYQGTQKSIGEIGRELRVDYIIEGSVRRDRNRVRITVALIRVDDQAHLWAANYDGSTDNVLKLQVEVTRDIIRGITSRIGAKDAADLDQMTGGRLERLQTSARRIPGLRAIHALLHG
jgi:TolB-like protein/DNA-binding winged helix-turn-helix (wHTH) protein